MPVFLGQDPGPADVAWRVLDAMDHGEVVEVARLHRALIVGVIRGALSCADRTDGWLPELQL